MVNERHTPPRRNISFRSSCSPLKTGNI
jgi:hypothetical protein